MFERIQILIPMAGAGSRFKKKGFKPPKPLIDVHGKPMIAHVINNLKPECDHTFIFACQESHLREYSLEATLRELVPECQIVPISELTDGAARTCLTCEDVLDLNKPMMIANCDQWINLDINSFLQGWEEAKQGHVMCMKAKSEKWSYIKYDDNNNPVGIVEKRAVSEDATVGVYCFRKADYFFQSARRMIELEDLTNGEYYVAPTYTHMVEMGYSFSIKLVGDIETTMFGLGTPEDLDYFIRNTPESFWGN